MTASDHGSPRLLTPVMDALRSHGRIDVAFVSLLVALVILPLYPKVGLLSVSGTYVPVRLDDIVTVAVSAAWAWTLWVERRRPRVPPIAPFVLAWLACGLLALVIGAALLQTIGWATGFLFWAKPIEYLLLGWVAYDLVDRPERLRTMLWIVFLTAAVVLVYAMLERFEWVAPAPNYATDVTARRGVLGSTMGDQHQMATYLGIVTLVGLAIWYRAGSRVRWLAIAALPVTAYVVVHAAGRSEFFSLLLCSGLLVLWKPARRPASVLVLSLVAFFFLPGAVERSFDAVLLNPTGPSTVRPTPSPDPSAPPTGSPGPGEPSGPPVTAPPIDVSDRVDDLGSDRSLEIRLKERWPMFFRIALRDPVFGAGPSAATEAADGYYVRSFTEVGIVGTLAFLAMIGAVLVWLRRVVGDTDRLRGATALGLIAATLFTALVGVLIDTWVASRVMQVFWPLVGAALAVVGPLAMRRAVAER